MVGFSLSVVKLVVVGVELGDGDDIGEFWGGMLDGVWKMGVIVVGCGYVVCFVKCLRYRRFRYGEVFGGKGCVGDGCVFWDW